MAPKDEVGVRPYTPKPGETFADVARQNSEEMERSKAPSPEQDKIVHMPDGVLRGPTAQMPNPNQAKITDLHNKTAGPIVASIVRPMVAVGANGADILLLLESIIVGTLLVTATPEGDGKMLALLAARAGKRLIDARAKIKSEAALDAAFARPSTKADWLNGKA